MPKKDKKPLNILILTHTYSDIEAGGEPKIVCETSRALARAGLNIYVAAARVNLSRKEKEKTLKVYQAPFCKQVSVFDQGNMLKVFFFSLVLIFIKRINLIHLMPEPGPCPFVRFRVRPLIFSSDIPWDYKNPKYSQDLKYDQAKKSEEKNLVEVKTFCQKVFDKLVNYFYIFFNLKERYPRSIDLYACTSTKLIERLKSQNYSSKFALVKWGVNPNIFHTNIKPIKNKKDNFVFLFIGTLCKRKGVEYLIKAFAKLNQKYKNIELFLIGGGVSSTIKYFKQLAGQANIKFIGPVLPIEIPKYLVYADVFVFPSLGEPFGLVNLEAMACGKPVISTNAGGVPDYFKDKEVGFLVEPANVDDLANTMEKFLNNHDLINKMGQRAREYVIRNFTWDITAKKMITAYQELLNDKK